jgi:lysozyme
VTVRKTTITVASAAALALALPAIKQSEGYWPTVKTDWVGTGHPATGGYGETENVKLGETHTEKYWSDRLQQRVVAEYDVEIGKCIHVWVPDSVRAAMDSTAYNTGPTALCRSSIVAKLNAGDFRGACNALAGWYIRASGRVVQGLINRRAHDRKLCLSGVTQRAPVTPEVTPPKKAWWQK